LNRQETKGLAARLRTGLVQFPPSYFTLVMSTGIVSIVCYKKGWIDLATGLYWLNLFLLPFLIGITVLRAFLYPRELWADLRDHKRSVQFLALVVAITILGTQAIILKGNTGAAVVLLFGAFLLWLVLIYGGLTVLAVRKNKPLLREGISGYWLLIVVSTHSISLLSAYAAHGLFFLGPERVWYFGLAMFSVGSGLYLVIITLIFYRFMFFRLRPIELEPPYWINSGSEAITALAGATLISSSADFPITAKMQPFLLGFSFFFWANASWWIPWLLLLNVWRHLLRRVKLVYDPYYWSTVFPLGMYAVCTWQMSRSLELPLLSVIPDWMAYGVLGGWFILFFGLLRRVWGFLLSG
jgi:tellurite resistance protein TehA-like permease